MDDQQYSLTWNHFHSNMSDGFQVLLQEQDLVDVTLAVDGKYFKAHKMVLSICSPYFKQLFQVSPCKHPIIILQDVQHHIFKSLLLFMYQGEVQVTQNDLAAFMKLGEVLKIKGLTDNDGQVDSLKRPDALLERNANGMLIQHPRHMRANMLRSSRSEPSSTPPMPIVASTSASISYVQPKRRKLEMGCKEEPITSSELDRKSKEAAELALRLQALKTHQKILKRQQKEKKPPMFTSTVTTTPSPSTSQAAIFNHTPKEEIDLLAHVKEEPIDEEYGHDEHDRDGNMADMEGGSTTESGDSSTPGTLQCIIGKRGLPRLIVNGHTFYKKSTYKNKCFWYCKTSTRLMRCSAVCWTVHGRIVKWPAAHSHDIVPETINPTEDSIVPTEMLRQVLIDAAK